MISSLEYLSIFDDPIGHVNSFIFYDLFSYLIRIFIIIGIFN